MGKRLRQRRVRMNEWSYLDVDQMKDGVGNV
jgi:hypothetical protein